MSKYLLGRKVQVDKMSPTHAAVVSGGAWQRRAWWAFNWFISSIQTPVLCPSATKFNRETIFSWHMLWHPYSWGSCQHTSPANPECNVDSEWDISASRESFKIDKCEVLASLGVCVCVLFSSQSSCQHQTIRALTPPVGLAGLPPMKAWEPSEKKKKKTGSYSTRTWFSSLRHTHASVCVHAWLRGSPPHGPSSEACQTLTPLIICPDAEVWAGVITSEPWLFTQRSGPDRARIIPPGFS